MLALAAALGGCLAWGQDPCAAMTMSISSPTLDRSVFAVGTRFANLGAAEVVVLQALPQRTAFLDVLDAATNASAGHALPGEVPLLRADDLVAIPPGGVHASVTPFEGTWNIAAEAAYRVTLAYGSAGVEEDLGRPFCRIQRDASIVVPGADLLTPPPGAPP
jgi:hypothetical protein